MLIESLVMLESRKKVFNQKVGMRPSRILMTSPEYFEVIYAINPHMKDESGNLKQVDRELAIKQWHALKDKYISLGLKVDVLPGKFGFPDMVFCANQSLPFWDTDKNKPAVIISNMRSEYRQGEVEAYSRWYKQNGYIVHELPDKTLGLEGNGDALVHPGKKLIWGGCGPRTDREIYKEVTNISGHDVIPLPLMNPDFYHLDTCFSILDEKSVVIQPEAFDDLSRKMIATVFENVIETTISDCSTYFTGNCHSPNGKDVITNKGCTKFEADLVKHGYKVHPVDTSEFIKSGGSVFCMKMMCY
jgi:N-dimethylarginine dimethylaminohydrolase